MRRPNHWLLVALFGGSGTLHLVRPQIFEPIIPPALSPYERETVVGSGIAELTCAAGLALPWTRRLAGLASAGLLVGVLPSNVQMSLMWARRLQRRPDPATAAMFAATVVRVPLQWPLVMIGWRAFRSRDGTPVARPRRLR
ncbi:MAG TPA: DoxX family protein [Ornithinimicrobium sp.]|uniref:DoxX family protein n=1 Tax=Ornithinimicrobium sp. TaxID=1977084 RepID=UPI002B49FE46|nr:DoxX family protein [Ornithinimicrobium sp.]HKJ12156.1 DoxX family protein [Ornithinimicrobium sp.]